MKKNAWLVLVLTTACGTGAASHHADDAGPFRDAAVQLDFQGLFGAPVTGEAPPPIAGGTLLAARDRPLAFVSDPDNDRFLVVDTDAATLLGQLAFSARDEPGRAVEDGAGRIHVILRRGGALATIDVSDPTSPQILSRREVCLSPRGVAYDAATDRLFVVCTDGSLSVFPPLGECTSRAWLLDDLRDVVVDGPRLLVTRFRSAEVLVVDPNVGIIADVLRLPQTTNGEMEPMVGQVAWRAIPRPGGGAIVLHQRESVAEIDTRQPDAYGSEDRDTCSQVVDSAITAVVAGEQPTTTLGLRCAPLVVDVALSPDGVRIATAAAGAMPRSDLQLRVYLTSDVLELRGEAVDRLPAVPLLGRIVAVAYAASGQLLAQTRDVNAVVIVGADGGWRRVTLGGREHADTGHDLFHSDVGVGLACASCHPEGGDDGHVWNFASDGLRRTIPLHGGVSATAPYHWTGEFSTMDGLLADVFARRMGGGRMPVPYRTALVSWLDSVPLRPGRDLGDPAAVNRGRVLFQSTELECTSCHAGLFMSNETTVDVGTGGSFQVPSLLGVGDRAPYLHDGRAARLEDRFTSIGGGDMHGHTSQLDDAEIADLVAYLQSL